MPRENSIAIRRGPKSDWDSVNPVLNSGEFGFDTTSNLVKIGNGTKTWQELSVLAMATPVVLSEDAEFTNKITVRSPIVNLKDTGDVGILTVPDGYMFAIDSMEVLTTSISQPGTAPNVRFGNLQVSDAYHPAGATQSNALGARHVIETPQDAAPAGTTVTFGVTAASTAGSHAGCGIVTGHLIRVS
jgi:hypothetical protein